MQQRDDSLLIVVCLFCSQPRQPCSKLHYYANRDFPHYKVTTPHNYCLFWRLILKLWNLVISIHEWQLAQIMGALRIIYGDIICVSEFITALWALNHVRVMPGCLPACLHFRLKQKERRSGGLGQGKGQCGLLSPGSTTPALDSDL